MRMPTMRQGSGQQLFGVVEELCNAGIGVCAWSHGQGQMKLSVIRNANLSADQPLRIECNVGGLASMILRRVQDSSDKPKPKVLFEAGEVVRVNHGPFADFNGVVEEVNYEKNRLRVAVLIFGRSTPVDLQFDQVEKG